MKNILVIILTSFMFTTSYSQDHVIGLGCNNFSNVSINYERIMHSEFKLKLSFSRNFINGDQSSKKITYNFTSLSAKIFSGDIFDCDFYHGPGMLFGYYYEHTNFNNNTTYYPNYDIVFDAVGNDNNNLPYYQNSSMISPQYNFGLEREVGNGIFISADFALGTHFLFNDYMTILDKYNMGNFVPYLWLNLNITYNYPNSILAF